MIYKPPIYNITCELFRNPTGDYNDIISRGLFDCQLRGPSKNFTSAPPLGIPADEAVPSSQCLLPAFTPVMCDYFRPGLGDVIRLPSLGSTWYYVWGASIVHGGFPNEFIRADIAPLINQLFNSPPWPEDWASSLSVPPLSKDAPEALLLPGGSLDVRAAYRFLRSKEK